jgi:hypothetical protein
MKYYTISYPGELGQHIQETLSEFQILQTYFEYWCGKMIEVGRQDQIGILKCIEDWITIHFAVETDEFGNKVTRDQFGCLTSFGEQDCV